ncbi:serine hydrolase domain-containing protein [Actinomadura rugatobispora]|uniref:Serine hydrolase domain-containing protein n=1 Tax=Actinomadura rugatobispora TaxID=1994 RepID=A0ABW1A8J4_9ACTN
MSGALALTTVVTAQPAVARTDQAELRRVMQRLTAQDGAVGAQALVTGRGERTAIAEGLGDVRTGTPMPRGGRFRIGSLTKPFVATVVLQLVGEGKVELDAPVERYLPGVVRGNGNDGREITVRNLLQHTTGLPDYLRLLSPQHFIEHRYEDHDPRELLQVALDHDRLFEPRSQWSYSNTNYILVAMIIERVTGRSHGEEIDRRIVRPLHLRDTSVPGDETGIGSGHARGYVRAGSELLDLTELNASMAFGGGDMISSAADVNRFLGALVRGRLLRPDQQREMMTTRPTGGSSGSEYGLGLQRFQLDGCEGEFWGHGGDMLGYTAKSGVTLDGRRQVTVMINLNPGGTQAQEDDQGRAVSAALCD